MMTSSNDEELIAKIIFDSLLASKIIRLEYIPAPYDEFCFIFHHQLLGDIAIDQSYERMRELVFESINKFISQGGNSPREYLVWMINEYAYLKK